VAKIRCLKCEDIIESKHQHDFKWCKCGSCFIDGGKLYTRLGGELNNVRFVQEDGTETYVKGFEPNEEMDNHGHPLQP
jgi:hypothetical protein